MATEFQKKVYSLCKKIPEGKVSTYKEIATAMHTKAYRAVGTALNRNPHAPKVPCHRVVNSDGRIGGFSKGKSQKKMMLEKEGVRIKKGRISDLSGRLITSENLRI